MSKAFFFGGNMRLPIAFQKNFSVESILGGAISLTMATLVVKILGFLYKIPLAHILGSEGMSYFNGAYAVYSFFFVLCSAGIPKAVSIATTAARTRGDGKTERRILTLSTILFGGVGLLLSLVVASLCQPLSSLVGIDGASNALFCIAPSILFVTLGGVLRGALTGRQRLIPVAMSQVIEATIKLIFGTLFAIVSQRLDLSLEQICGATITGITLGSFVSYLYLLVALRKSGDSIPGGEGMPLRRIWWDLIRVILPISISSMLLSLSANVDLYLILDRLRAVGYSEEIANKIYGAYSTTVTPMLAFVGAIVSSIALACFPHLTRASVQMEHEKREEIYQRARSTIFLLAIGAGSVFFCYGREIIFLVFPQEMVEVGGICLRAIAPATVFLSLLTLNNTAMEAAGNAKAPLFTTIITLLIKIPSSYILIGDERFGILGAPIGTVLSYAVAMLLSCALYRKEYGRHGKVAIIPYSFLLCATVAFTVTKLIFKIAFGTRLSVFGAVLAIGASGFLYLVLLWMYPTHKLIKRRILSK